jgi:hypothetical protein
MKKEIITTKQGIIGVLAVVGVLFAIFTYVQVTYSNKLKSLTISVYSPEIDTGQIFQQIKITKSGCSYRQINEKEKQTIDQPCSVIAGGFEKIQKDFNTYALVDKLQSNQFKTTDNPKDGGIYNFTAELNNGDKYSLNTDIKFVSQLQPLMKNIELYAPSSSEFGLVEKGIN